MSARMYVNPWNPRPEIHDELVPRIENLIKYVRSLLSDGHQYDVIIVKLISAGAKPYEVTNVLRAAQLLNNVSVA